MDKDANYEIVLNTEKISYLDFITRLIEMIHRECNHEHLHILHLVFSIFCLLGSVWLIFCCRSYSLHLAVTSFSATTFAAEGNSIVSGRRSQMLPKQANTEMDGIQMVSIWFSDIFPCHVRQYGFSDLPCGKRFGKSA